MKITWLAIVLSFFIAGQAIATTVDPTQPTATCKSRSHARVEFCHLTVHASINAGVCTLSIATGESYVDIDDDEMDAAEKDHKKIKLRWKIKPEIQGQTFRFTTPEGVDIANNTGATKDFKKIGSAKGDDVSLWKVRFKKTSSSVHTYDLNIEGKARAGGPWISCPKLDPIIAND